MKTPSEAATIKETDIMQRTASRKRRRTGGSTNASKAGKPDIRRGQGVALALALCCAAMPAARAADLPAAAPIPLPVKALPIYNWSGFYIGGNIGAAWSGLSGTNFSDTLGSSFTAPTNVQFMGGGQIGVNYQFWNGVVIGAEAMFDWLPNSQSIDMTATDPTGLVAANISPVNARWLTTATGKLGYAFDRILLYAKGGGAWVAIYDPTISVSGVPASFTGIGNTTSFGYTAGFGLEWAFAGNWSVRAEYDYIGLPSQNYTVAPATPTFGGDVITSKNRSLSIFTTAVDYKFGGWW
jgi:outer membrane immunogenic protein